MYPKIMNVIPEEGFVLIVNFENNVTKKVDMIKRLNESRFNLLKDKSFFEMVRVDTGGYGVSWNDDIDMSEYELWESGKVCNLHQ